MGGRYLEDQVRMLNASAGQRCIGNVDIHMEGCMVCMSYGDKQYQFNTDGYNYIYCMKCLFNNGVIDAILR